MLQNIRDNAQGLVAKIIIGLIVISFAFFGVESLLGGGQTDVASVNGEDITQSQLNQAMLTERNRRMQVMGENIDPEMLGESALRGPAVERLVQQQLLLQVARDRGIGIADSAIDQNILSMSQFQENGAFSADLYQNILRSNGLTPGYFKQLLRTDLIISQLSNGMAASDFVTEKELASIAEIVGQKRSFTYLMLPRDKVSSEVEVNDTEIEQYYADNQAEFKTEERVKLSYIEVKQQDFFKPVTEEAIEEAFALEQEDFKASEERRASHILIEVNDERDADQALRLANELKQKLAAGEAFADLAKEYSEDIGSANNGGDLGFTSGETFPEPFEKALFALDINEISDPVLTDAGYHLIQATEINFSDRPTYEDRKPVIEQRLKMEQSESDFVAAIENLRDLVFNSDGLKGPARELGLSVATSGWISRTSQQAPLNDSRIIKAAFSDSVLKEGNNSEVIELAEDHFIVVHVTEHDMPRTKPLETVKDSINARLAQEKTTAALQSLASDAIKDINANDKSPAIVAEALGEKWSEHKALKRTDTAVNRELLMAVFGLPAASEMPFAEQVTLRNGNVAVVILEAIEPGKLSEFSDAERMAIKAEMQRGMRAANIRNFVKSIREKADIEIL